MLKILICFYSENEDNDETEKVEEVDYVEQILPDYCNGSNEVANFLSKNVLYVSKVLVFTHFDNVVINVYVETAIKLNVI